MTLLLRKYIVSVTKPLIICVFCKKFSRKIRHRPVQLKLYVYRIKKKCFYMYRSIFGGVWIRELLKNDFSWFPWFSCTGNRPFFLFSCRKFKHQELCHSTRDAYEPLQNLLVLLNNKRNVNFY